jgi:hypothetical protein
MAAAETLDAAAEVYGLEEAALLESRLMLPLVWDAAAFEEFVCKFVTSRWACRHCCSQAASQDLHKLLHIPLWAYDYWVYLKQHVTCSAQWCKHEQQT